VILAALLHHAREILTRLFADDGGMRSCRMRERAAAGLGRHWLSAGLACSEINEADTADKCRDGKGVARRKT
jgi:hypothetical protein